MSARAIAKLSVRKAKEERARLREERKVYDVNKDYPPWAHVEYELQTEHFFNTVRDLPNEGLNPITDLIAEHVSEADIAEVFGGKGVKPFKTTNVMLHPATKGALLKLCWRIYGTAVVPNNEFMAWIVKGFIAEQKGDMKINWAVAAASTVVEKKRRDAAKKSKLIGLSEGSIDVPQGTGNDGQLSTQSRGEITSAGLGFQIGVQPLHLPKSESTLCPYEISTTESQALRSAGDLVEELLKAELLRVSHLEGKKKTLERKLVGLRFNLEDRIRATKEDEEELASAALAAQALKLQLQNLREQVTSSHDYHFLGAYCE
jgi:hypothetical protein